MKVRAISVTEDISSDIRPDISGEDLMVYCARVSSPQNQGNTDTGAKLLKYCFDNGHWSVFEMADFTVEIETSLAIATQLLRHKSASFQQFSGRYAVNDLGFEEINLRRQDTKNRQNSIDDIPVEIRAEIKTKLDAYLAEIKSVYEQMLELGVARECARMILPQCTTTRIYMKNSVRGWIHYLQVRLDPSTQLEHREVALAILEEFKKYFPVCAGLLKGEVK